MIDMTSDSENKKALKSQKTSPSTEEFSSGSGGGHLKKGPWTSAEDDILVEYVTKHGEGNWNAVQKYSGLSRCGKSCRLRWANHLRPGLKKGAFTPEEETRIVELHASLGNKWACMAAELPGRTDNEIKNYWNTRIKRLQRAGLPVYPPDICVRALDESQLCEDMVTSCNGDTQPSIAKYCNGFEIPDVEFKNLELNQILVNCCPSLPDIPSRSLLQKNGGSSHCHGLMLPSLLPHKRFRKMETQFCDSVASASSLFPLLDQYEDDTFESLSPAQSLWSPSHDPDVNINKFSPIDVSGSHAPINGNSSSSVPLSEAMKLELPSLQYSASLVDSWAAPCSPLPYVHPVDTSTPSPLSEHTQSSCPSPWSSGLLEAIVYESKSLKGLKKNSNQERSETSRVDGGGIESSSQNVYETKWDAYGEPISPLSQSEASVFVECTPISGGSSTYEPQSAEIVPGCKIKPEEVDCLIAESEGKKDVSCQLDFLRPDALLDSFCSRHCIGCGKDQSITADVEEVFGDELNCTSK